MCLAAHQEAIMFRLCVSSCVDKIYIYIYIYLYIFRDNGILASVWHFSEHYSFPMFACVYHHMYMCSCTLRYVFGFLVHMHVCLDMQ
jgi:hypothetical protein